MAVCGWCNGTGREWITCVCEGKGCQVCRMVGQLKVTCSLCNGTGKVESR